VSTLARPDLTRPAPPRPALTRPAEGRWLAGVAAGTARHLRVHVRLVRVALVILAGLGGIGVVAYALLWGLVPPDPENDASRPASASGSPARRRREALRLDGETTAALGWGAATLALGLFLLGVRAGLPLPPAGLAPVALGLAGLVVVWGQLDASRRGRWLASAGGSTREGAVRLGAGVALTVAGILLLVLGRADAAAVRSSVLAALAVLAGVALLLAPWAVRLWRELAAERSARLREAERAEVAAHLHDSVLQTLALIQRRSGEPTEVARLARAQERELRDWLYGGQPARDGEATLAAQVRAVTAEVEDAHGVPVDLVLVGDGPLDRAGEALVQALREATLNAVRHGRPPVQVYVESGPDGVEAFVRDHGDGFDPEAVPPDRLGVRESVLGRMSRAGGSASVRRAPGGGTEVALRTRPRPEPEESR